MLTDNEVIKAYGCCNLSHDECGGCDNCPCKIEGECIVPSGFDLEREVFNLLNRQKAEIERLKGECVSLKDEIEAYKDIVDTCEAKAGKGFAERLNKEAENVCIDPEGDFVETDDKIYDTVANWCRATSDNLLEEMVGEG